jgi:hypothetical protein
VKNKTQRERDIELVEEDLAHWRRQISLWGGDTRFAEFKRSNIDKLERQLKELQKGVKK